MLPAAAHADEPQILDSSAGARSGADRIGGVMMTAPAHASTACGQSPSSLSTDDTKKEHPRNRAVVGPPVPRKAQSLPEPPPPPEPQSDER